MNTHSSQPATPWSIDIYWLKDDISIFWLIIGYSVLAWVLITGLYLIIRRRWRIQRLDEHVHREEEHELKDIIDHQVFLEQIDSLETQEQQLHDEEFYVRFHLIVRTISERYGVRWALSKSLGELTEDELPEWLYTLFVTTYTKPYHTDVSSITRQSLLNQLRKAVTGLSR